MSEFREVLNEQLQDDEFREQWEDGKGKQHYRNFQGFLQLCRRRI